MEHSIFSLEGYQRSFLRKLAHGLKPVVAIGNAGLTPEVKSAVDAALSVHELIKVKFQAFHEERCAISEAVASETGAQFISLVGHVLVLYRPNWDKEDRIRVPKR